MRLAPYWNGSRATGPKARCIEVTDCWQLWFDGAAAPNPGPMGLGGLLLSPAGERLELSRRAGASGCNNEAELLALGQVLDMAYAAGARRLTIRGDSDFAVQHLQGGAHTAVPRLVALLQRLSVSLGRFDGGVEFFWVPRHRNGEADRLSRLALGLNTAPPAPKARRRRGRR